MRTEFRTRNQRVLTGAGYLWFGFLSVLFIISATQLLYDLLFRSEWQQRPWTSMLALGILAVVTSNTIVRWLLLLRMARPVERPPAPGLRVAVATTYVPNAEPLDMLERTVRAIQRLTYPHDTWVLDEGDLPAVKELCSMLGVHHFSRKNIARYQAV